MILWMTRDAFSAAVLGFAIIVLFVGYNSARHGRRRNAAKPVAKTRPPASLN
jgi:hypothetical protein